MKLLFDLSGTRFEGLYAVIEIEKVGVDKVLLVADGIKPMRELLEKVTPRDVEFSSRVFKGIPASESDAFPLVDDPVAYKAALSNSADAVEVEDEMLDGTEIFLVPLRSGRSNVYFVLSPVMDDDSSYEACTCMSFDPEELSAALDVDTHEKALVALGDPREMVRYAASRVINGAPPTP